MERRDGTVKRPLVGLVGAILTLDVVLTATGHPGGTNTSARLLLAVGAVLAVLLGVAVGFVDRPSYALGTVLASPLVALYAVTGLLLPWDQVAFVVGQRTLEGLLAVPVVGEALATALLGGTTLSSESLEFAARYHGALLLVGGVGFAAAVGPTLYRRVAPGRGKRRKG